jgi:serine/threonine protein kinase
MQCEPPALARDDCPSEEGIACFIDGQAEPRACERILNHLDGCSRCRTLVAGSLREPDTSAGSEGRAHLPRTFRVGAVVNGRYRIERFVARGGMGEVYQAWDLQLEERVALKTIACAGLDDTRLLARMRAEVQLARRVTHPNVCRILEFGLHPSGKRDEPGAIPFFTMEFLEGETLAARGARKRRLTPAELWPIGTQILDGLAAIHAAGIIHRDLKPENVVVPRLAGAEERAVVMDFGLARPLGSRAGQVSSQGNLVPGTPAYMAPEQALGGAPSTAWDIFAFGVLLFKLMAGELPFKGDTMLAVALARECGEAPRLSSVVPGTDRRLEALVARCLRREPARRFVTVEELRRAFAALSRPDAGRMRTAPARAWLFTLTGALLAWSSVTAAPRPVGGSATHGSRPEQPTSPLPSARHPVAANAPEMRVEATAARSAPELPRKEPSSEVARRWARLPAGTRSTPSPRTRSATRAPAGPSRPSPTVLGEDGLIIPSFAQPPSAPREEP